VAAPSDSIPNLCTLNRGLLVFRPVIIQIKLSDRIYRSLERMAASLESIDQTLKAPPEDFTKEDQQVIDAAHKVEEAIQHIPHSEQ